MKKYSIKSYYNSHLDKLNKRPKQSLLFSHFIDKRWVLFDNQNNSIKTIKFNDSGELYIIINENFTIHKWSEENDLSINLEIEDKLINCIQIHYDENVLILKLKNELELITLINEAYYYKYIEKVDDKLTRVDKIFSDLYRNYLVSNVEIWVDNAIDLNVITKGGIGLLQGNNFVEAIFTEYYEAQRYLTQNPSCKSRVIEPLPSHFPFFIISNNNQEFGYASDFEKVKRIILEMYHYNSFTPDNKGFVGKIYCVIKPILPINVNESILGTLSHYNLKLVEVNDLFFENFAASSSFLKGAPFGQITLFSID